MNGDQNNNSVLAAFGDPSKNPQNASYLNINASVNKEFTYEHIQKIADWLLERTPTRPKLAVVCGSGLGGIADRLQDAIVFPYSEIPNFPQSTGKCKLREKPSDRSKSLTLSIRSQVSGHKGNLIFGSLDGVDVVCMQGRFHTYEGYASSLCTLPIKVFKLLGVKCVLLTCAAGGINESFEVGDIMMIKDHLAIPLWSLINPLVGHNDENFGPRFPPSNSLYKRSLRDLFRQVADELNIKVKEGVYAATGGPSYETVTEIRALKMLGADAVGMSVTHEAVVAGKHQSKSNFV
jgi:purine-nucleoside phosphorylase